MQIDHNLKCTFVNEAIHFFETFDVNLRKRLDIVYPLFGLKWCTILLNEFVTTDRDRREFAKGARSPDDLVGQLDKAWQMMGVAADSRARFPYVN